MGGKMNHSSFFCFFFFLWSEFACSILHVYPILLFLSNGLRMWLPWTKKNFWSLRGGGGICFKNQV